MGLVRALTASDKVESSPPILRPPWASEGIAWNVADRGT